MTVIRPIEVRPQEAHRLWLRYQDGTEGTVDLSDLAGRGVFKAWNDPKVFQAVRLADKGALEWPGGVDLCGDALYMQLTGKAPDEVFASLRSATVDA